MRKGTRYFKVHEMEKPLSLKRNVLWHYKCPFINEYRGGTYAGFMEFTIFEPHTLDLEQPWFQPVIKVHIFCGKELSIDFTLTSFQTSAFNRVIDDQEDMEKALKKVEKAIKMFGKEKKKRKTPEKISKTVYGG